MSPLNLRIEAPPLYFLHVPKTAGLSLRRLFESAYAPTDVLSLHHARVMNDIPLDDLPRYRCYLCHFGIGLYDLIGDLVGRTDLLPVTMLRNPIERAASHYYYHRRNVQVGRDFLDEAYIERFRPLVQSPPAIWQDIPELADILCDVQVRELGIAYDWRPFFKPTPPDTAARQAAAKQAKAAQDESKPSPNSLSHLLPAPGPGWRHQADMAQVTAEACRRLEGMAVVGITERFDESIEMICAMLGIPPPTQKLRANVGPHKADVDVYRYRTQERPEFLEQIEALTTHDQELYAYGCELFEQQLALFRAGRERTYSIGPRIRIPARRIGRATWQHAGRLLPGPERAPRLHRWKSWIEHRL